MLCLFPMVLNHKVNGTKFERTVPCGQCTNCRINRQRMWQLRILGEASEYDSSLFITLTYDGDTVPLTPAGVPTLNRLHLTNFIKRYRKSIAPRKIRFFGCGEYGKRTHRPHYHAIIFNGLVQDEKLIEEKWQCQQHSGFVQVSPMAVEHAQYVAKYCLKQNQQWLDSQVGITPEFSAMSRKPGIGRTFLSKLSQRAEKLSVGFSSGSRENPVNLTHLTTNRSLRIDGKLLPLGRYGQNLLLEKLGGLEYSDLRKALIDDMKSRQKWRDPVFTERIEQAKAVDKKRNKRGFINITREV